MSQLKWLIILVSFFSFSAQAFQDTKVHLEIRALKASLARELSVSQRVALTERFKNFMDHYLQAVVIERTEKGREEFASLNEFEMALFTIKVDPRNPSGTCRASSERIRGEGRLPDSAKLASSAVQALEILSLICR